MKPKNKQELAWAAGYQTHTPVSLLLSAKYDKGAAPDYAYRLGRLTGSDPEIWLKGGGLSERLAAFERWKKS